MTRVRRAIGPIAAAWLVCQTATLTLVPVLLEVSLAECVCPQGGGATCPMHHKTAAGSKVCVMRSAGTSVPAILNALFSVAGLLPTSPRPIAPVSTPGAVPNERSILTGRPSSPDPPPPRA
jgi:hypothetical protein